MNEHDTYSRDPKQMADRYRDMKVHGRSMYAEAMWQYQDMAHGGDGGELYIKLPDDEWAAHCVKHYMPVDTAITCRAYNYPNHPNSFFVHVLELLGETD